MRRPRPEPARSGPSPRPGRPESAGVRAVLGLVGLASTSALAGALLPSVLPRTTADTGAAAAAAAAAQAPEPSVLHLTRVIQLAPGETAPPGAVVDQGQGQAAPAPRATPRPTPRVIIQTITRQSGQP